MDYFKTKLEEFIENNFPDHLNDFIIDVSDGVYSIRCGNFSIDYIPGKPEKSQIYVWGIQNSGPDFMELDQEELKRFLLLWKRLPDFENVSCKFGLTDCICDPLYIKHHYPDWFKKLYPDGDITNACEDCEDGDGYDDEDK